MVAIEVPDSYAEGEGPLSKDPIVIKIIPNFASIP
jgi:hypothetical protein